MSITITELLSHSYGTAVTRLIPMTQQLSAEKSSVRIEEINRCFAHAVDWQRIPESSGHNKYKHRLTGIVVTYQAHASSKDCRVKPRIKLQILEQIRLHLNTLGNEIFCYTVHNWKAHPDYDMALTNYNNWIIERRA